MCLNDDVLGIICTMLTEDDGITDEMADDARTGDDDASASGATSFSSLVTGVATAAGAAAVISAYAL